MIFYKNMLIEIKNNKIIKTGLGFYKNNGEKADEMVNKNLYITIYDEEVYIKTFLLPKAKGELLYNLVKNELSYSIGNISNILFDYKVIKHLKSSVRVIVFYINSQKIAFIKEKNCYKNIKRIILIQFAMKEYYKKSIRENNYIMAFIYDKAIYILALNENNLVANSIVENFSDKQEELIMELEIFKNKYSEQCKNIKNIYLSNIDIDSENRNELTFKGMTLKILDKYKKEKLIDSFL